MARSYYWTTLASLLFLHGCVSSTGPITYFEPSGDGRLTGSSCFPIPDSIDVPIAQGVRILLSAKKGVFTANGYSDRPGTTFFGEVYVPAGARATFVTPTFAVHAELGQEGGGTISEIKRTLWYGPKRNSGVSMETQLLSPSDTLTGWTPDEVRSSGLVPAASYVDGDLHNRFKFLVPLENFVSASFTTSIPDIAVNSQVVAGKSIRFTRTELRNSWSLSCP
jgi:hypothetical protein